MKKDKARDIGRGVLPSKRRKSARDDKRGFHKVNRAAQRAANDDILRRMAAVNDDGHLYTDAELFDDYEGQVVIDGYSAATKPSGCTYDHDIGYIVARRRDADKLGPLIRWAKATHDKKMSGPEWTTSDKVAYFKAVLPDSLQGRHALGHVKDALDLYDSPSGRWWFRTRIQVATPDELRKALCDILSTSKGRMTFHDFRLETVPVAAHTEHAANLVWTQVQAVNEKGEPLYSNYPWVATTKARIGGLHLRPIMTYARVPQPISATCDTCAFMRDDPLHTQEAINRFVDVVTSGVRRSKYGQVHTDNYDPDHRYITEIRDYLAGQVAP